MDRSDPAPPAGQGHKALTGGLVLPPLPNEPRQSGQPPSGGGPGAGIHCLHRVTIRGDGAASARHPGGLCRAARCTRSLLPSGCDVRGLPGPQAIEATAAAGRPIRNPEPDATAPGGGEKNPPTRAQGSATKPTRTALAPGDTLHHHRSGMQGPLMWTGP